MSIDCTMEATIARDTGLDLEQVDSLKMAFDKFDKEETGVLSPSTIPMILKMLGVSVEKQNMEDAIQELQEEGIFDMDFMQFCMVAARFMCEGDEGQIKDELRQAFKLYDKDGHGYITTQTLKEILHEIDQDLTQDELNQAIEEVDVEASGTLNFDQFVNMMMG